jgi:uncharacterized protein (DUF608 family)
LDRVTVDAWRKFQNPETGTVIHSITCNSRAIPEGEANGHRLDMPAQFVFQTLRAALWSGDEEYLRLVWPNVKNALAYVLRDRDDNGDHLPDMEGIMCSYDNFPMYGVAPFVVSQWLAAVALALRAGRALNDQEFVDGYTPFFEQGRETFDVRTWNGSYFKLYSDHQESDPAGEDGCMTDQLLGDGVRFQLNLPPVVDEQKVNTALDSILEMNYKPDQGLRNCQWPGDEFLHDVSEDTWVDQANTCWTGVEVNFAAQLYYHGRVDDAERVIRNVDERHRKWGIYFDHQEFGGHYFRPMSALAIPNAYLGLRFDGETLFLSPAHDLPSGKWCFLLPGAYGTFVRTEDGGELHLLQGRFTGNVIQVDLPGSFSLIGFSGAWGMETNAGQEHFRAIRVEEKV